MSSVKTSKLVNPGQLSIALGRKGVRIVGPYDDDTFKITVDDVSEEELEQALENHIPDPNWVDPNPPPVPEPVPTIQEQLDELKNEVKGMKDRAAAATVSNSDVVKLQNAIKGPPEK